MRPRVSLVIITLNEEANIRRCIESVQWIDDVIVLDSGSRDRTREIARNLGARVFDEPFRGFRAQKERATESARHDWVLSLDADEALSPELSDEILRALENGDPQADGFKIPRLSFHLGRWIKRGGWYPDRQIRLFNRRRSKWTGGHVHERVMALKSAQMESPILHWVFRDLSHQVQTNNRYSSEGAKDLFDKGRKSNLLRLLFKPISKFVETYFVKLGFLDGIPGFVISVGASYSMFLKYAKLWELQKIKERDQIIGG